MKRYVYSLLLLTALSTHLESMDDHDYWQGGGQEQLNVIEAQEQDLLVNWQNNYIEAINNQDIDGAMDSIAFFLDRINGQAQIVEVMSSLDNSPLILAIQAHMQDLVNYIIQHPNFIALPEAANYLQTALESARRNNYRFIQDLDEALVLVSNRALQDEQF